MAYSEEQIRNIVESEGYKYYCTELREMENGKKRRFVKVQCPKEHEVYWVGFFHFKDRRQRCPNCCKNKKITNEEILLEVEQSGLKLIEIKSEEKIYKDNKKRNVIRIVLRCSEGHEWETNYSKFKNQKTGCKVCKAKERGIKSRLNFEEVKEKVEKEGYKLLSKEYECSRKDLTYQCDKGHMYDASWNEFQRGCRCPYCKNSKGEEKIKNFLENKKIEYLKEKRFDDCKFKYTLPFDFYLLQYNCCIEYDGIQHFEVNEHFGGEEEFERTKIRDTIKNEYCKKNNIKLIRIPYWDYDRIEEILKRELEL